MSLKDNYFRNSCAKLLIFPLSCKFSRWNIVKINRKCVAIFWLFANFGAHSAKA